MVEVMEPTIPVEAAKEVKSTKSKITWRDFPIEDHIRAYVGCPSNCTLHIKTLPDNRYRVNVNRHSFNDTTLIGKTSGFEKSVMIQVDETPDGYEFKTLED